MELVLLHPKLVLLPINYGSVETLRFDPCIRNDSAAQIVCQHTDGIYCLKGNTDLAYGGAL